MPQGLQIWNSSGQLIFDTNDRVIRQVGTQVITTSSGTGYITVSKGSGEYIWFQGTFNGYLGVQVFMVATVGSSTPDTTGNVIRYNVYSTSGGGTCTLTYGVF